MKVKTHKKLNQMFEKLTEYDYKYIDDLLTEDTDCYTIDGEGNVEEGVKLCLISQSVAKPIYKITNGDIEAFFIGDYVDVESKLGKRLQEAQKAAKESEAFLQSKLSESERGKLLFLLDALKVAPEKSKSLIKMIKTKNTSTAFKEALNALSISSNLKQDITDLRKSLK